ncbi:MAG: hypothetical protein ABW007_06580 [Chitinophagaceae bacterium]
MDYLKKRANVFLVPYIYDICGVAIFNIIVYWLLAVKLNFLPKEIWVFLPVVLSIMMSRTWLTHRLSHFVITREKAVFGIRLIVVVFYSVSMILLQDYLYVGAGKLVSVKHITDAAYLPASRYYKVEDYFIDKKGVGSYKYWETGAGGKKSRDLKFSLYLALPIINQASDSVKLDCSFFLFKQYKGKARLGVLSSDGSSALDQFVEDRLWELDTTDLTSFTYFEVVESYFDTPNADAAVLASNYIKYRDPVILKGHTTAFSERNKGKPKNVFIVFITGILILFLLVIFLPMKEARKLEVPQDSRKIRGYSI